MPARRHLAALLPILACLAGVSSGLPQQPTLTPVPTQAAAEPQRWSGSVRLPNEISVDLIVTLTPPTGTIDIPMQGAKGVALSEVQVTADAMSFTLLPPGAPPEAAARFSLTIQDGNTAIGSLVQGGATMPVKLTRLKEGETATVTRKAQDPVPPFPYAEEEVTFANEQAEGVILAGTLTLPEGDGPFPAAILVSGSGPQNRDSNLLGHRPFLVLADHLTRQGIAVLRYDDRGIGASTGDFTKATTRDFAKDTVAAVKFLRTREEIDPARVGIIGHSEGGIIAPIAAAELGDVGFLVLLAAPGVSGLELIPRQAEEISLSMGAEPDVARRQGRVTRAILTVAASYAEVDEIRATIETQLRTLYKEMPETASLTDEEREARVQAAVKEQLPSVSNVWYREFLRLDPRVALSQVRCPVLAINGAKDVQVPAEENLATIQRTLEREGNTKVRIETIPDLNHLFQTAETGGPDEYATIEETFAPVALEMVAEWVRSVTGLVSEQEGAKSED